MTENKDYGEGTVHLEIKDQVGWIRLNRPHRRNALTPLMIEQFVDHLETVDRKSEVRCVVITGEGEKAFCAGFDIHSIQSPQGTRPGLERDLVEGLCSKVSALRTPTVAMINGHAVGTGCDLALCCDIRITVPSAKFGMPPAKLGVMYSWQGLRRFVNVIGPDFTKELFLTGSLISGDRTLQVGLVHQIVPPTELLGSVESVARDVLDNAPLAVTGAKRIISLLVNGSEDLTSDVLDEIARIQEEIWNSIDAQEGAKAFVERRKPNFVGR